MSGSVISCGEVGRFMAKCALFLHADYKVF